MKKALIIAPHPDDAEIAMGGTIAAMIHSGWEVIVVDLTDGEPTPFGTKNIRAKEVNKANRILGIKKRICLDMQNRYLQATLENRRKLAEVIRLNEPDILFGPLIPDWHPDHKAAFELIEGARFEAKFFKTQMKGKSYWAQRLFFYYSPHRLEYQKPSFIVDISKFWNIKISAIKAYKSQLKNSYLPNTQNLVHKLEITARFFGQSINAGYGEPFVSYEPISTKDISAFADF